MLSVTTLSSKRTTDRIYVQCRPTAYVSLILRATVYLTLYLNEQWIHEMMQRSWSPCSEEWFQTASDDANLDIGVEGEMEFTFPYLEDGGTNKR